jgi:hypothetical protein
MILRGFPQKTGPIPDESGGGQEKISKKMLKFGTVVPLVDSEVSKLMKIERSLSTVTKENFCPSSRVNRLPSSQTLDSASSCSLEMSLAALPDVRASEVARGKALIADPSYPSRQQLQSVARVLVKQWSQPVFAGRQ